MIKDDPSKQRLSIFKYRQQIITQLHQSPVLIISGLTGCGKSTQVPQFLFQAFPQCKIAVCEPRRLAATSLARRVSSQRGVKLGGDVGYQIGMESKRGESTRIVYMTYGILIQELLFRDALDYDFVVLDQVHERSLEMDFAFVILKKIINQRITRNNHQTKTDQPNTESSTKQRQLKMVIMSATINSQQFQKYFSSHNVSKLLIEPQVAINNRVISQKPSRSGNRHPPAKNQPKKQLLITYQKLQQYSPGSCISICQSSPYTTKQLFLQDFLPYFQIKPPSRNYPPQDIRLTDTHYQWGKKLILKVERDIEYTQKNTDREEGDILVFLPGLIEINRMKEELLQESTKYKERIVEVHSSFSEELYFKLFQSKVKNKIILATNIGQSSITLPNCKAVIDYCLNRKAAKNSTQGISRFTTTIASLSNLIQRKGRVGRVSDGIVYRMITMEEFQNLQQFDVPQIKCVSLEMSILKTKKLEQNSKNRIFEDIYSIFLNVLQPPQFSSIQSSIATLIHEDALQYIQQQQGSKISKSGKKYIGSNLSITKVGQFMVSMPCDLSISKLILMGIKLGISSIIIDIASIILSPKSFFCHQQRRFSIQQFMHSIIGYDKGDNNDYLLRQRLFQHWRMRYYLPFRDGFKGDKANKRQVRKDQQRSYQFGELVQFDQDYLVVERFLKRQETVDEKDFCKNRGVYPNFMRELLRMSQTLKIRIEMLGVDRQKLNTFQPESQLILICLMYAFPDLLCQITPQQKKPKNSNPTHTQISLPCASNIDQHQLSHYMAPIQSYSYDYHGNNLFVSSTNNCLKKFLLPKHYIKANTDGCSYLFKHCKAEKVRNPVEYTVYNGYSAVNVLNQSINKEILPESYDGKVDSLYMITHNLIQSKGRYMVGANALLDSFKLVIISMIVKKNIKLCLHPSKEFFSHILLSSKQIQIPVLLCEPQLALILLLRSLSKRSSCSQISLPSQQLSPAHLQQLSLLFQPTQKNLKPSEQQWEELYIDEESFVINQKLRELSVDEVYQGRKEWVGIDGVAGRIRKIVKNNYYQRYNKWKLKQMERIQLDLKLHSIQEPILICGICHKQNKIVQIAHTASFDWKNRCLKLNRYSGSWKCPQVGQGQIDKAGYKILCTNNHQIGVSISQDVAQIFSQHVYLYSPFNRVYHLSTIASDTQYSLLLSDTSNGLTQLTHQQKSFSEFKCTYCYTKQNYYPVLERKQLEYNYKGKKNMIVRDVLWNQIIKHANGNQHIRNKDRFRRSIRGE